MRFIPVVLIIMISLPSSVSASQNEDECAVLLHGHARTSKSLKMMELALQRAGYRVLNVNYESRVGIVEEIAPAVLPEVFKKCGDAKINIITHSLGGILVRYWLLQGDPANIGRIVMLAPPNKGSEIVDNFAESKLFKWRLSPALEQLSTSKDSLPNTIDVPPFEIGIIAGNRTINPLTSHYIAGDNDGKVSVESTKLEDMKDHITLPVSHTYMMNNPLVIGQVKAFLSTGGFDRSLTTLKALKAL